MRRNRQVEDLCVAGRNASWRQVTTASCTIRRASRIPSLGSCVTERVVTLTQTARPPRGFPLDLAMMAKVVGVSASSVQRIWQAHGLQPHRLETSNSPTTRLRREARGHRRPQYHPPAHAVVLRWRETEIQALDRTQPGLPLEAGKCRDDDPRLQASWPTTLFAALNVLDGAWSAAHAAPPTKSSSASSTPSKRGPRPKAHPRHRGQLRNPQAPQGAAWWLASPLDLPLHPHIRHPGSTPSKISSRSPQSATGTRGVFRSVVDLQAAINRFVIEHSAEPEAAAAWTADPDENFFKPSTQPTRS